MSCSTAAGKTGAIYPRVRRTVWQPRRPVCARRCCFGVHLEMEAVHLGNRGRAPWNKCRTPWNRGRAIRNDKDGTLSVGPRGLAMFCRRTAATRGKAHDGDSSYGGGVSPGYSCSQLPHPLLCTQLRFHLRPSFQLPSYSFIVFIVIHTSLLRSRIQQRWL